MIINKSRHSTDTSEIYSLHPSPQKALALLFYESTQTLPIKIMKWAAAAAAVIVLPNRHCADRKRDQGLCAPPHQRAQLQVRITMSLQLHPPQQQQQE